MRLKADACGGATSVRIRPVEAWGTSSRIPETDQLFEVLGDCGHGGFVLSPDSSFHVAFERVVSEIRATDGGPRHQ